MMQTLQEPSRKKQRRNGVDFIAEVFLCAMILFGDTGAQPAA